MNKNLLSEAIGRIDECLIAEAISCSAPEKACGTEKKEVIAMKKHYENHSCEQTEKKSATRVSRRKILRGVLVAACVIALAVTTVFAVKAIRPNPSHTEVHPAPPPVKDDAPYANEVMYIRTDPELHPMTEKMQARMEAMEEDYEELSVKTVRDVEDAYGVRLLQLNGNVESVDCIASLWAPNGIQVTSSWKTRMDDCIVHTDTLVFAGSVEKPCSYQGVPVTKMIDSGEYVINALGVTAGWNHCDNSGETIVVTFIYDGIHYNIFFNSGDLNWVCAQLENLHYAD